MANLRYNDLSPQRATRCEHVPLLVLGNRCGWKGEISNSGCLWDQVEQEIEPFADELAGQEGDPRNVATWPAETGDKSVLQRILGKRKNDWNRCGGVLSRNSSIG